MIDEQRESKAYVKLNNVTLVLPSTTSSSIKGPITCQCLVHVGLGTFFGPGGRSSCRSEDRGPESIFTHHYKGSPENLIAVRGPVFHLDDCFHAKRLVGRGHLRSAKKATSRRCWSVRLDRRCRCARQMIVLAKGWWT
jgi:hypothetical protein